MRIVFFGTPEFAVPSLDALVRERFTLAGVVTQPDRPHGRSRSTLTPPPVKQRGLALGVPVLQPELPLGDLFLAALRHLEADLGVVVAYGHILRPEVLAVPPRGMINVHASLLPRHRGAAPIQHAILAGDRETGVSIMQMEAGLDSGPVFHRASTPIAPFDTGATLADRLARMGAVALIDTLSLIAGGVARPQPQDGSAATYAPKITRESARVVWTRESSHVARVIRAFDPAPGAWTMFDHAPLKLFQPTMLEATGEPGAVLEAGRSLVVACGDGAIGVEQVQPAGRKRLPVEEWVRGRAIERGARLG